MAGIVAKGIKPVIKGFDKRIQLIEGDKKIYSVIASMAYKDVIQHFDNTVGRSGIWQPLAASTIRQRRRGSSKPLQDTGVMKGSIRPIGLKTRAEVFTNIDYAKYHDLGTRNIPRREFMWLSGGAKERIRKYVERALKSNGN
jgi:phage gpG-like protein